MLTSQLESSSGQSIQACHSSMLWRYRWCDRRPLRDLPIGCRSSTSTGRRRPSQYVYRLKSIFKSSLLTQIGPDGSYEMFDYVISLREGIMDAWGGIIGAMKLSNKSTLLHPFVESIFALLNTVWTDPNKSDALMRSSMGVIGYVCSHKL